VRRPVNGVGNSWADRVRGMHHAAGASVAVAESVSEVTEPMPESTATEISVHTEPPQQQAVTNVTGKH